MGDLVHERQALAHEIEKIRALSLCGRSHWPRRACTTRNTGQQKNEREANHAGSLTKKAPAFGKTAVHLTEEESK
jgi:hypothetical protein